MNFRDVFKAALEDCEYFDALVIDPYNSLATCEDIKGNSHERDYAVASVSLECFVKCTIKLFTYLLMVIQKR